MTVIFHQKASKDIQGFVFYIVKKFKKHLQPPVLIKPNIVSFEQYPTTTHPKVLECVIKALFQLGFKKSEILVGDASAPDSKFAAKEHELASVSKKFGVRFVDFVDYKFVRKSALGLRFKVSRFLLEAGSIISLPVLKTHAWVGITGALKNMFGFLDEDSRIKAHRKGNVGKIIVAINLIRRPTLSIVNHRLTLVKAQEVRHGGVKRRGFGIFASLDPVALDWLGLKLQRKVDKNVERMRANKLDNLYYDYIKLAHELGVGSLNYELVEF